MLSADTKESIRLYLKGLMSKDKIEDGIALLDEYLDYINSKYGSFYRKTVNDFLSASIINQRTQLKSFLSIELFMGELAEVLHLKENKEEIVLPSEEKRGNVDNKSWGLERLYKVAFELFPYNCKLSYESQPANNSKRSPSNYEYHFLNLYYYRNNVGEHYNANSNINDLSLDRIGDLTQSMLYAMVYLVSKYQDELSSVYDKNTQNKFIRSFDSRTYASRILNEYSKNQSFEYLDTKWDVNSDNSIGMTINDIIDENFKKTIIAFVGEAGTGKTTALKRLEYEYAKKCSKNSFKGIPVYIELKNLRPSDSALASAIAARMDIPFSNAKNVIDNEPIVVLLDGFNEISDKQFAASIKSEVEEILDKNDKILLFITDRTNKYTQFNVIQTTNYMYLHEISLDEKIRFFEINSKRTSSIDIIKKQINDELNDNSNPIVNMLRTPYMLSVFLSYVDENGSIPDNPIEDYIEKLFIREEKEQKDQDDPKHFEKMKTVLAALACKYENSEFRRLDAQHIIGRIKELFGYSDLDSVECIELSVKMGLLESCNENRLQFKSKEFNDYFYMYALTIGLDDYIGNETA